MSEERFQEKYMEYQGLVQQFQQLKENSQTLEKHILELNKLKENLDSLSKFNTGEEALMSLGSGIFLKGEFKDNNKVLMSVGSGICVEKNVEDAIKTVDRQMVEVVGFNEQIKMEVQKTVDNIQELQLELQNLQNTSN